MKKNKILIGDNEILKIIEDIANQKGLSKNSLFSSIEKALSITAKKKYGSNTAIKTYIDRNTGSISFYREFLISDNREENEEYEILSTKDAKKLSKNLTEGNIYKEPLPPLQIARPNAISVRNILVKSIKDLERNKLFEEYKCKIGTIITGIINKITPLGITVKIDNNTEGYIKTNSLLKSDTYKQGDRIKALLLNLSEDYYGPIINLSRTNNNFVIKLFEQTVPEIEDKIVEIKAIAREPYSRTKIAVHSNDSTIDAVGACVGIRGCRVKSIISELREEKIDIIYWNEDPATMIVNALSDITKVFVDKTTKEIEAIVPDEKLSQAIGRKGQNVKLISDLLGWKIDIRSESSDSIKRKEEFKSSVKLLTIKLDVEPILAQILVSEGFNSIQKISNASIEKIEKIEGIDKETAEELIIRAKNII